MSLVGFQCVKLMGGHAGIVEHFDTKKMICELLFAATIIIDPSITYICMILHLLYALMFFFCKIHNYTVCVCIDCRMSQKQLTHITDPTTYP